MVGLVRHQHVCYMCGALSAYSVLIALLPIISTTFWVHENFHLWMVFLVCPSLAVFMGCRKHKNKMVVFLSTLGVGFYLIYCDLPILLSHRTFF